MREKLIDLIIEAKRTDPETDSFTEYLADFLIKNGVVIADEVVSKELYKQIKWERDTALNQLERVGLSLGEKTDNIVSVVRCSECAYAEKLLVFENSYSCLTHETFVSENDYCSYGEPKAKGEE
ncbi:MAG: hypothetical protein IKV80_08400 [Bacteroidales bacterium]|nr:hypothetical protein [Bacteroidales bacterium]